MTNITADTLPAPIDPVAMEAEILALLAETIAPYLSRANKHKAPEVAKATREALRQHMEKVARSRV